MKCIFVAQKRALRTMFFVKLYVKDEITGEYSYGHTKHIFNSNEILTVHNVMLMQCLNLMHKIYKDNAPTSTKLFFIKPETNNTVPSNLGQINKTLQRQGIDQRNVLTNRKEAKKFFTVPKPRLQISKYSLSYIGPLAYNDFVNKLNNVLNPGSTPTENLMPLTFKEHIKEMLLKIQSSGDEILWEPVNSPLYNFQTYTWILRSDSSH